MVRPYKEGFWITLDYKKLKIEDMETSHIKNTIKFLEKRPHFYDETYSLGFTCDGYGDGEMIDVIYNKELVDKKIKELKNELIKRGEQNV